MGHESKTKRQLIDEQARMGQRVAELERLATQQKRNVKTVRKVQGYAEAIIETIREPLLILDKDLKVLSTSPSFYDTFKVTPDETLGQFIYDLGDRQWDIPALRKLLEDIVPQNTKFDRYEVDHVFPTIGYKSMLINARRVYRKGMGTQMILLAIEDITDFKQAEETLKASETRYRRLFETAQDGILILNAATGQIDDVNPFLIEMLGYTRSELLGKKLWEIGAFKDTKASRKAFKELQYKGYVRYEDLPLRAKDGRGIDVEFVSNTYQVNHTNVIQCNIRDITEHKQAEDALQRANKRFRATLESITDGFVSFDKQWRYTYVNEAAARLLQHTREGLVGRNPWEALSESAHSAFYTRFTHACNEATSVHFEEYYPAPLNRWFECHCYPEPQGLSVYFRDVTDRKEMEEVLKKAHDELEQKVKERTAELTQAYEALKVETEERRRIEEQLLQAQKMEAIGTLAGGIAHDFNNILAAIIGFTEMVIEDIAPDAHEQRSLKYILKSAHRAKELVKQILAFSRKTENVRSPMSLTPIVKETIKFLRASIPATIEIVVDTTATSDVILASPVEVQQILMNLCTNAVHAMQGTGGTLKISLADITFLSNSPPLEPDMTTGEYVEFTVRDTGTGMSPEVMQRIFDPFFTTNEVGKGTGMGLAVVYGIVKSLGGSITVESKPNTGSAFHVFLPKTSADVKPESVQPGEYAKGTERILFADDETLLCEWGQSLLQRLGYKVTIAADGAEALEIFSADPSRFDLVITDQAMPRMSGLHLAKELLKIRSDIPIILVTGHCDATSPETAKETGVSEFLLKPLGGRELTEAVRRVLDSKADEES